MNVSNPCLVKLRGTVKSQNVISSTRKNAAHLGVEGVDDSALVGALAGRRATVTGTSKEMSTKNKKADHRLTYPPHWPY